MDAHSQQPSLPRQRPADGWSAWQATLGYISQRHSPDAVLMALVQPDERGALVWSAAVMWGQRCERVTQAESISGALAALWQTVDRYHRVFVSPADAVRAPAGYADGQWFDASTLDVMRRVLWLIGSVFGQDWLAVLVYRPAETPARRVQMRLVAGSESLRVGGYGPTLLDALRDVFRRAAPAFSAGAGLDSTRT